MKPENTPGSTGGSTTELTASSGGPGSSGGSSSGGPGGCASSADCPADQVCVLGECVPFDGTCVNYGDCHGDKKYPGREEPRIPEHRLHSEA